MIKRIIPISAMFLVSSIALSQTTLEVSRITCDQFTLWKIKDPQQIAIWLSGYYNGLRKNTMLDLGSLEERADQLKDFCYRNPKVNVMDAAEKVFQITNTK
jgi:acid stress chaperone HdeB